MISNSTKKYLIIGVKFLQYYSKLLMMLMLLIVNQPVNLTLTVDNKMKMTPYCCTYAITRSQRSLLY